MENHRKAKKMTQEHNTISSTLLGILASTFTTVAPMFLVIGGILVMYQTSGYSTLPYTDRLLFSCSILYIFIFSLLCTAPFNPVLSRYIADRIFEERFDSVLPCFYGGLCLNLVLCSLIGIPFYTRAVIAGDIEPLYSFICFCGFIILSLTFYCMLYLSITKDYRKISLFFAIGSLSSIILCLLFIRVFHMPIAYGMLLALVCGFFLIAVCEFACIRMYFSGNDQTYGEFLGYFRKFWPLAVTNLFYSVALYIHNFIFWTTPEHLVVSNTYICYPVYDMATCIAMFTNISASVILITQIELHFHERYKAYSEAVIGGRLADIKKAKKRMFTLLSNQLIDVARNQFIISVIIYLLCMVFLPRYGFAGLVMDIYPCMAAGYFLIFLLYATIIYLYYFSDLTGALLTSVTFLLVTGLVSLIALDLPPIWYGIAAFSGAFAGWTVAYSRLRWIERNLDEHIFCQGTIIEYRTEDLPDNRVHHTI